MVAQAHFLRSKRDYEEKISLEPRSRQSQQACVPVAEARASWKAPSDLLSPSGIRALEEIRADSTA